MPLINVEGVGLIDFPEGMSGEQIDAAIKKDILPKFPKIAAQTKRTWGEAATDIGAGLATGIGQLAQVPGQLTQLAGITTVEESDAGLQGIGKKIEKFGEEHKSATLKGKEAVRSEKIAQADGILAEFGTAIKETIKDPALLTSFFTEQLPNLAGSWGGGLLARGTTKALMKAATQEAIGKAGVRGAVASGAVMQGADIGSETYEAAFKEAKKQGMDDEQANGLALAKGRMAGIEAAMLSFAATKLPGGTTIEKALAGQGIKGGAKGFIKGLAEEAVSEGFEEGSGKFASNVGVQEVNPALSLSKGVGAAAGMGALGGGLFGGMAGHMNARAEQAQEDQQKQIEAQRQAAQDLINQVKEAEEQARRDAYEAEQEQIRLRALQEEAPERFRQSEAFAELQAKVNKAIASRDRADQAKEAYKQSAFHEAQPDLLGDILPPQEQQAAEPVQPASIAQAGQMELGFTDESGQMNLPGMPTPVAPPIQAEAPIARPVTEADFATMNIGKTNKKLREALIGKDLNDPAQVQEVRDVLENWVQKGRSEPINKGVAKFLDSIPKPLPEQEQGKLGLRRPYGSVKKAKPEAALTAEEQDLLQQELQDEQATAEEQVTGEPVTPIGGPSEPSVRVPSKRPGTATRPAQPERRGMVPVGRPIGQPIGGEAPVQRTLEASGNLNARQIREFNEARDKYFAGAIDERTAKLDQKLGKVKGDPQEVALNMLAADLSSGENLTEAKRFHRGLPEAAKAYVADEISRLESIENKANLEIAKLDAIKETEQQTAEAQGLGDVREKLTSVEADLLDNRDALDSAKENGDEKEASRLLKKRKKLEERAAALKEQLPKVQRIKSGATTEALVNAVRAGNLNAALNAIAKDTSDTFNILEKLVSNRLLANKGSLPKIEIVPAGTIKDGAAQYNPFTDTVQINEGEVDSHTVLHETVHGFLHALIQKFEGEKGIKNKGISDMKALYDFIKENHPNVAKEYGMSSLTEFASELMSNRDFQQTLAQIPYRVEHQSLFTAFIRAVLNALGLSPTQKLSALARGLMAAEQSMAMGRKVQEDVVTGKETMPVVKNTDAFRRWFGDSKVVDANGQPIVMYHGTTADLFTVFDKEKIRENDYDTPFNGFWFSSDKFTSPAMRDAKNTIPVYLSIKNPAPSEVWKKVSRDVYKEANEGTLTLSKGSRSEGDEVRNRLQAMGYDGVHYDGKPNVNQDEFEKNGYTSFKDLSGKWYTISQNNEDGGVDLYSGKVSQKPNYETEEFITGYLDLNDFLNTFGRDEVWVAFEPNQIKSATQNTGAYSLQEDSIVKVKRDDLKANYEATGASKRAKPTVETGPFHTIKESTKSKEAAKQGLSRFLNTAETMLFSADAALNNAIRKGLEAGGNSWNTIKQMMYDVSTAQATHADAVAMQFLEKGNLKYDEETRKWVAEKSDDSWAGLVHSLSDIAKKYDLTFDEINNYAQQAFVADRLKGLAKSKVSVFSHMTPAEIEAGVKFFDMIPELREVQKSWNKVRKNAMDIAVAGGLYSEEQAKELLDIMDYVPFYRIEQLAQHAGPKEYGRGLIDFAKGFKLKGGEQEVANIFDNMERWTSYTVARAVKNRTALNLYNTAKQLFPDEVTDLRQDETVHKEQNTIDLWENGQRKKVEFKDPLFIHAFTGIESAAIPHFGVGSAVANFLRKNIVLMPLFSISQLSQDSFGAMLTSGLKHPWKLPIEVAKEFYRTLKGRSESAKELAKYGATGVRDYSATFVRESAEIMAGLKQDTKTGAFKRALENFAMASDNAVRQAIYNMTLRETGDKALAVERAFEIINFKRAGASGKIQMLRQVVPFFGAYLQAQNVIYKTISGKGIAPQQKKEALRVLRNNALKIGALAFMYAALASDDEDYQKMDPQTRDRHLLIPGTSFMLPLRSDLTLMPKLIAEYTYLGITDNTFTDGKKIRRAMSDALANAVMSPTAVPQAVKPILEVATNHNFFTGRSIVGQGIANKITEEQYTNSTSELGKLIGKTGMIAPVNFDHLFKGYMGTTGGLFLQATSSAMNMGEDKPKPEKSWQDTIATTPGLSAFVAREYGNADKNDFYELRDEVDKINTTLNAMKKQGRAEDFKELFSEKQDLMKVKTQVNTIGNQLTKLREYENHIYDLPESRMSAEKKGEEIRRIREQEKKLLANVHKLRQMAGY